MPLLKINAMSHGFALHDSPQCARARIAQLSQGAGPVIIMIHGLKYEPAHPVHCPHVRLFDEGNERSWSSRLLRAAHSRQSQLCIGFGWSARGGLRRMHARANEAAFSLANLIRFIRRCTENRPIHIIAHSLGAKVALSVLAHLAPGDVGRMILLTGASHRADALRMLGSPAGRTVEVLNVTTRENDLFDLAFEQLVPGDGAIGRGLDGHNVLNL